LGLSPGARPPNLRKLRLERVGLDQMQPLPRLLPISQQQLPPRDNNNL
jgi:hypothetical protein